MIYMIAYTNPESPLPEAVVEIAKSTIQLGNQPVWFIEAEAENDILLDLIWPDGQEEKSPTGPGVLVQLDNYSGYAQNRLWDWLKARIK